MKNIVSPLKLSTCATLILLAMNGSASADGCSATCGSAGIGNRVWFDADKDGIQDEIEWHGVNNVKLSLTSCSSSTVLAEEWLNKDGYFAFDYLAAGSYKVTAQIPTGYVFTQPKAGNDNDVDSDITLINGSEGSTDCITINANESVFTVDIGLTKPVNDLGSIGDTVFNDLNKNGFQDGTEAGISGVTINLSDGWGNPIGSAVTDASGQYAFQNLAIQDDTNSDIGCYETSVVVPTSGNFLNATITTDSSRWACLDNGQYDTAHDYGLYKAGTGGGGLASIGDFFWHDANGDGVQDSSETGIPKAAIYLYDSNFSYVTHERTDGNGKYTFTGLTQGCYWLDAVIPDSGTFSAANFTTDSWVQACVQSGEQKTTFDFGVNIPVVNILSTINGTVWNDVDADQTQNGSEVGISGAQVTILDQNGVVVGSVLSDASGNYSFPNLADGCYTVR
ncbi:MAG: hypothetical protein KAG86_08710, partial [Gammaproteobacteria bacterium]|nr:hypothetical protein [Gammaproteobacteria bacterium]